MPLFCNDIIIVDSRQDRIHTRRRLGCTHGDDLDAPRLSLMHHLIQRNALAVLAQQGGVVPHLLSISALLVLCQCSSHGILEHKGPFCPLASCRQSRWPRLQQKLMAEVLPPRWLHRCHQLLCGQARRRLLHRARLRQSRLHLLLGQRRLLQRARLRPSRLLQ